MKLTVIGGGGVRSMFLAKSIAQRAEELHIDELVFMDNDPEKLRIYGGLAGARCAHAVPDHEVHADLQCGGGGNRCGLRHHDHPCRRRCDPRAR